MIGLTCYIAMYLHVIMSGYVMDICALLLPNRICT